MTAAYILTTTAEAELRDIIAYSFERWGDRQAEIYSANLLACMNAIAGGRGTFLDLRLHPDLRMLKCGHHYIFCLLRQDSPSLVIALLHERMDIMTRLDDRLR